MINIIHINCPKYWLSLKPYGSDVWMEFLNSIGPVFFRSENSERPMNPGKKTWKAYKKWEEEHRETLD